MSTFHWKIKQKTAISLPMRTHITGTDLFCGKRSLKINRCVALRPSTIVSTDEKLSLFRFVKVTVQKFVNGRGKSAENCTALVDMHVLAGL